MHKLGFCLSSGLITDFYLSDNEVCVPQQTPVLKHPPQTFNSTTARVTSKMTAVTLKPNFPRCAVSIHNHFDHVTVCQMISCKSNQQPAMSRWLKGVTKCRRLSISQKATCLRVDSAVCVCLQRCACSMDGSWWKVKAAPFVTTACACY